MAREIERKFLVVGEDWRGLADGTVYRQGYLSTVAERTVRVRVAGDRAFLTIKGLSVGAVRAEYEYGIPVPDADEMLDGLCEKPIVEKTRYRIPFEGWVWEVDEFAGVNAGLIVAEIELDSEAREFVRPDWVGDEVTGDARYFNANLIASPFSTWGEG
jgi:CYTH domain-containing protein